MTISSEPAAGPTLKAEGMSREMTSLSSGRMSRWYSVMVKSSGVLLPCTKPYSCKWKLDSNTTCCVQCVEHTHNVCVGTFSLETQCWALLGVKATMNFLFCFSLDVLQ